MGANSPYAIRWYGIFDDRETEEEYRQQQSRSDLQVNRTVMLAIFAVHLMYFSVYLMSPRIGESALLTMTFRILSVVFTLLAYRMLTAVPLFYCQDWITTLWCVSQIGLGLSIFWLTGSVNVVHAPLIVVCQLLIFILPIPLLRQSVLALLMLGGYLGLLFAFARAPTNLANINHLAIGFVVSTVLGVVVSSQLKRHRRQLFADAKALGEAMATIRSLEGLLPICSFCKKIRDNVGRWTSIEAYVQSRTNARFSHGICPRCTAEQYPEFTRPVVEVPTPVGTQETKSS